jgi:hypothetical protein
MVVEEILKIEDFDLIDGYDDAVEKMADLVQEALDPLRCVDDHDGQWPVIGKQSLAMKVS